MSYPKDNPQNIDQLETNICGVKVEILPKMCLEFKITSKGLRNRRDLMGNTSMMLCFTWQGSICIFNEE